MRDEKARRARFELCHFSRSTAALSRTALQGPAAILCALNDQLDRPWNTAGKTQPHGHAGEHALQGACCCLHQRRRQAPAAWHQQRACSRPGAATAPLHTATATPPLCRPATSRSSPPATCSGCRSAWRRTREIGRRCAAGAAAVDAGVARAAVFHKMAAAVLPPPQAPRLL